LYGPLQGGLILRTQGRQDESFVLKDNFTSTSKRIDCPGNTYSVSFGQKAEIFMGQWELDHYSPLAFGAMLLGNIAQDTVESLLDVRHRQVTYTAGKP
jgi:hypothetical protein